MFEKLIILLIHLFKFIYKQNTKLKWPIGDQYSNMGTGMKLIVQKFLAASKM